MKLHPRVEVVNRADLELRSSISNIIKKYDLTYGEIIILLGESVQNWAKYQIRLERHPDEPDKRGGEV